MQNDYKLRIEYMMLEGQYRKLEERIEKIEAELEVGLELGVIERIKNTSVSLFLLRRDRERLAEELGLPITDYASARSLIEDELEKVLLDNQDILGLFKAEATPASSISGSTSENGGDALSENPKMNTETEVTIKTSLSSDKPKRGRKKKAEEAVKADSIAAPDTKAQDINESEAANLPSEFEEMDAALSMWS